MLMTVFFGLEIICIDAFHEQVAEGVQRAGDRRERSAFHGVFQAIETVDNSIPSFQ